MSTLPKDLTYMIINNFTLITLQKLSSYIGNNIELYHFILINRYNLSLAYIQSNFINPINRLYTY